MNTHKSIEDEVNEYLELLRNEAERLRAASALGRIGVRTRGAVPTRGSASSPAPPRVCGVTNLQPAVEALSDRRPEVRREVCFALGEWTGGPWAETAVAALAKVAMEDPDAGVRAIAVQSLGKIGGPQALQALEKVAFEDRNEEVRARVAGALGGLAINEQGEAAIAPGPLRVRGAVRTRGAVPSKPVSPEVARIRDLLQRIRQTDPSDYVREMADESLSYLPE